MTTLVFDASLHFGRRVRVTAETQEAAERTAARAARAALEYAGVWPNDYASQDLGMALVEDPADGYAIDRDVLDLGDGTFVELDESGDEVESEYDDEVE